MSFVPKFQAQFSGAIVNQAIAILQRDFAPAIAAIAPPPARPQYAAFAEYKKNLVPSAINTPAIIVAAREVAFAGGDDLNMVPEITRLLFRLEIEDFDSQFCTQAAYDYMRALDQVMRTASMADWVAPLPISHPTVAAAETLALAAFCRVKDVVVETHDFGVLWEAPKGFGMRPGMTVLVESEEI